MAKQIAPYGSWASPIAIEDAASSADPFFGYTIVGFDDASNRIQLTFADNTQQVMATAKLVNNNADTQLTLGDGSTILLKGVTHVTQADFLN